MDDLQRLNRLIVPVYINEKIVLDMIAIIEDGFSMVSQVNYTEYKEGNSNQKVEAGFSTAPTLLGKLLKINMSGELNRNGKKGENESVSIEKIHTNVSLFSKFRGYLLENNLVKNINDFKELKEGDFIEIEGQLEKNPLIESLESFVNLMHIAEIFSDKQQPGNGKKSQRQNGREKTIVQQMNSFIKELTHSGTIDFVLSDEHANAVLSVQEQYLANDNISEIIGGRFKVLGKVISVCRDEKDDIDLLRKTSLANLSEETQTEILSTFNSDKMNQFKLPEMKTKIKGPAVIVIPVAIYA